MKRANLMVSLAVMILTLIPATLPAAGQQQEVDVAAVLAAAPDAGAYPLADAVTIYEKINYNIDNEGRVSRRFHRLQRIQTNWGMRRLSDLRVPWDAQRQTLAVSVCRTHLPDGSVVDTPPNGFNEVTPGDVASCAAFLGIREMVISHVGVEPGAVLEIDYTVRDTQPPVLPAGERVFLQDRWPTVERQVSIAPAADQSLHFTAPPGWARLDEESGAVTVQVNNLPGWPDEGNGGDAADFLPSIIFGTQAGSLGDLARILNPLCRNALAVDDAMRAWLAQSEIKAGATADLTALDTIQRIAKLVGSQMRTVHLPAGDWSRAPRPAAEVFAGACATTWEKALLQAALLQAAGFAPEIGFVSDSRNFAAETPAMAAFAGLRVVLTHQADNYWLAPERSEAWPGKCDRANYTLMFLEESTAGFRTFSIPGSAGASVLAGEIRAGTEGGWDLVLDYTAGGLLHGAETDAEDLAVELAAEILPEAEVTSTEILELSPRRAHLRIVAKGETLGELQNGQLVVPLPQGPHPLSGALPASCCFEEPERHTPLFLPGELTQELRLRLVLPEGLTVACLPKACQVGGGGESSSYSLTSAETDGVVVIRRVLHLAGETVSPQEWPEFRALLIAAGSPAGAQAVFYDSREE